MTNRLFYEPSQDEVAHTSSSSIFVTDPAARVRVEADTDEFFPSSSDLVAACEKWGGDEEPHHTAWNMTNRTDLPFFEYLSQPEFQERADRFARAMQGFQSTSAYDLSYTINGYNWSKAKGTIVDIGGSAGETAIALARKYPDLPHIIVQDLPHIVSGGEASIPTDLEKRIFFSAHDFFTPQPESVLSAGLFLMRFILHDHPDKYARRIVRNILPALKSGATLVVVDGIIPPAGSIPATLEKEMRNMDLDVMSITGGKERQIEDWEDLFRSVDPKLIVKNVNQPAGSALGVMEVVWDG